MENTPSEITKDAGGETEVVDFLSKDSSSETEPKNDESSASKVSYEVQQIIWLHVIFLVSLHVGAVFGVYYAVFEANWTTLLWTFVLHISACLSITAGAHRLWAHKTYKARFPLRAFLVFLNCTAFQYDIIEWTRDHRCHHKWTDTNADPHNADRGLFFSHVGWLMLRKHPDLVRKAKTLDLSDVYAEKLLVLQRKLYPFLLTVMCFVVPTAVPVYFWGESVKVAFLTAAVLRCACTLNVTWCVNSIAHKFGSRPYDKNISPTENIVTAVNALGEGFHNYHHTFPQDYKTSEYPWKLNFTTLFIDFCALIGLAYDRKAVSQERIERQKLKYGDGTGILKNHAA